MDITERFLNYTKFDTQSSEESESVPSTSKQLIFANYLKEELEREGLSDVEMDDRPSALSPTMIQAPTAAVQTSRHASCATMTEATLN